jgi:hypothetical protein
MGVGTGGARFGFSALPRGGALTFAMTLGGDAED